MSKLISLSEIIFAIILLTLSLPAVSQAIVPTDGIVYVRPTSLGNGRNWEAATNNLQGAINAPNVHTVLVAVGNYDVPAIGLRMKSGVAIYGGFDPTVGITDLTHHRILPNHGTHEGSVLNGEYSERVVRNKYTDADPMPDAPAVLDGFTLKNGQNSDEGGGGIYNAYASSGIFRNLVIKDNKGENNRGAGVLNQNSSPAFINVIIKDNEIITEEVATSRGGGMANVNASPKLINVVITGNRCSHNGLNFESYGAGISNEGSNPVLINVTIADNLLARYGGGMYNAGDSRPEIYNSIFWGNRRRGQTGVDGSDIENDNSSVTLKNSITQRYDTGDATDQNKVNTDPLFAADVYTLSPASPAINAGKNSFYNGLNETTQDLAGNNRVYGYFGGGIIDMGAYEFSPVPVLTDGIIYVKPAATLLGNGDSWANATGNLHDAIHTAGVEKVFVAVGTYTVGEHSFIMKNGVEIYGGFDPERGITDLSHDRIMPDPANGGGSVLDGEGERPVIWNVFGSEAEGINRSAVLDGFTITNGLHPTGGGIRNVFASPRLNNLVIRNNTAGVSGAGIYNDSSSPLITNTVIYSNGIAGNNISGAGIYNGGNSAPEIVNVTIAGNILYSPVGSSNGSGMYSINSSPKVYNSIFWNNKKGNVANVPGADIVTDEGATLTLKNSITQDYTTGSADDHNKVNVNPLFTNEGERDFTLKSGSPAINAGNSQLYRDAVDNGALFSRSFGAGEEADLAGNLRITGDAIDMGAYENPDGVLPVRWISFEGRLGEKRRAVLTWKTEETNVSHYEVERSADARTFRIVDTVIAGSTGSGNYSLTDPTPVSGKVYYRIRQVDTDGAFSHSRIISLASAGSDNLFAYPNPLRERATVELDDTYIGSTVSLINTAGIILEQLEVKQTTLKLDMQKYAPGIYLLRTSDGKVIKLLKE